MKTSRLCILQVKYTVLIADIAALMIFSFENPF